MPKDQVKISKESNSDNSVRSFDGDDYPFGTSLHFEDELVDELGIEGLAVGDVVEVRGFAFVDRKSEHSSKDRQTKSVSLQMTSIKLRRETDDRAVQLYGDGS
jgi:hypothetical protein